MAPGRIKKWFKSLPLASGSGSHRSRRSDVGDLTPAMTEAMPTAASDLARDSASLVPGQIEVTPQATTSSEPAYRLDSEMASEYMKNIKRFRILVMGRANAGKTTILQRVCNSTDKPEIFDGKGNKIEDVVVQGTLTRGYHDIKNELVFKSNPGFVFHDSCGFEAGSTQQFDQMRKFVVDHAATRKVNERIHAIWFCIPMTDSHRTVTAAEKKFFNECDTGHVPVVVLLTKVDALYLTAIRELLDGGLTMAEAKERAAEKQGELLEKWLAHIKLELNRCKFPPRGYVALQKMHQKDTDCTVLMKSTANVMNEEGLQKLLISTQQSSVLLCIEYAVRRTLRRNMELSDMDRLQVNVKGFELTLLAWFPSCGGYYWRFFERREEFAEFEREFAEEEREFAEEDERAREFEDELNELPNLHVDTHISMPPLPNDVEKFPTVQSMVEHAIGCLLVAELSYFLMQHKDHVWKEVLSLAVEEYKTSNMQVSVSKDVKAILHDYSGDMDGLCDSIIKIIVENRMSNKFLMESRAK